MRYRNDVYILHIISQQNNNEMSFVLKLKDKSLAKYLRNRNVIIRYLLNKNKKKLNLSKHQKVRLEYSAVDRTENTHEQFKKKK